MTTVDEITVLASQASEDAREAAALLLERSASDARWAAQLGPALTQRDTSRLLEKSEQAVAKDTRLVRLRQRDGRPAYPIFQFDGRGQVPGAGEVVRTLSSALLPLTIASWLTGSHSALSGRRPIDALRQGDREPVLALASRLAHSAG